jgi:hypothetical protein
MGGASRAQGKMRMHTKFWFESLRRREYFGSLRHRWEKNIKIDLKDICCEHMDWIHLAQIKDGW